MFRKLKIITCLTVILFVFFGIHSLHSAETYAPPPQGGPLNELAVVQQVEKDHPDWLANMYDKYDNPNGTWEFLDEVVKQLHAKNSRWVYNGKRGNPRDPSADVVAYYYGSGATPAPNTVNMFEVYLVDIMTYGQSVHWNDVTVYGPTPCVYGSYLYPRNSPMTAPSLPETPPSCDSGSSGGAGSSGSSGTSGTNSGEITLPPINDPSDTVNATPGWGGNLAHNNSANNWLVVSQDNKNITGQLMSDGGKKIGSAIKIAVGGENLAPRVNYAPDLNKFLVVWAKANTNTNISILAQFVNPDGTLSGGQIQIDQGKFLFHANSSVEYDSKNKRFVIVWENRDDGVQVVLNTLSSTGQPGNRINITTPGTGPFNGAPSVAINEQANQYCVMYQDANGTSTTSNESLVAVIPVSAIDFKLGERTFLTDDSFFTYNIAYNSGDNNYMGIWSDYQQTGLYGKVFSDCKNDPDVDYISISEIYHNGNLSYNSKSNSYAVIVQEAISNNNHIYVIDADGGSIFDSAIFTGGRNGNFAPRVAANTTTGMYAAISSEDYATTKFVSNLGGSELLNRKSVAAGPFPAQTTLPVPDKGLPTDLGQLIEAIFTWSLRLIGLVIFVRFFYAGFLWFTAAGNSSNVTNAKKIMKNAVYGTLVLFSAWLILNTINPDLVGGKFNLPGLPAGGTGTTTGEAPSTALTVVSDSSCNPKFNVTPSTGCSDISTCVDVSGYTPTHGCETNNNVCLLSSSAAARAQTFIASFNTLASGKSCTLKISSTIQVNSGPSKSTCHKPSNTNSGTCADFNIIGSYDTCAPYFYQAAKDTGSVVSFLDEYVPACKTDTTTGDNIHVNF